MTYTAENILNIKRDGKLDVYLETERKLIASLEGAEIEETEKTSGSGEMKLAHFYGRYSAGEDFINASGGVFASDAFSSFGDLSEEWKNFPTLNAAKQYARAALRNHLQGVATDALKKAKARLASLEAAI